MAPEQPTNISVRQFVADSGFVTRGLRQGRVYTLTLNGEPLAKTIPIRRRRAVPKEEVLAIFATAPVIDVNELRADLDETVGQNLDDPAIWRSVSDAWPCCRDSGEQRSAPVHGQS
jgi:antitoxin (DNA-binding transcriptional repressor) of toxin-antitoxin stability system